MYTYIIIIGIILFLILSTILPTIFLFKRIKINPSNNVFRLKYLGLYCLTTIIYIFIFIISFNIYLYNYQTLDNCGFLCSNYTNSTFNIILGLSIHLINSLLFYILSKKIIIKFHIEGSKLKYLILSIYTVIIICIFILSNFVFGGILGHFVIKNSILNIIRWIIIFLPLFICFIDIFIIANITKKIINQ